MAVTKRAPAHHAVAEPTTEPGLDLWLTLLANEDRRALITHLTSPTSDGEASVGELAFAAGISRFSASRYVQQLREGGLIVTERRGNRVVARLVAEPFRQIDDWLWRIVESFPE